MDHFHGIELAIILYEHICDDNNNLMILLQCLELLYMNVCNNEAKYQMRRLITQRAKDVEITSA